MAPVVNSTKRRKRRKRVLCCWSRGVVSPKGSISSLSSSSGSSGRLYFRKGIAARIRIFCHGCCNNFVRKRGRKRLADRRSSMGRKSMAVNPSLSVIMEQNEEDKTSREHLSDRKSTQVIEIEEESLKEPIYSMQPDATDSFTGTDSSTDEDSESYIDDILGNDTTPSESCDSLGKSSSEISAKLEIKRSQFDDFAPQFSTMALESLAKNEGDVDEGNNYNEESNDNEEGDIDEDNKTQVIAEEYDERTVNVLQKKVSQFEQFTPEFSTMAMEDAKTKNESDIVLQKKESNFEQITPEFSTMAKEDAAKTKNESDIVLQKKESQFEQFTPEFSTMAMEDAAETKNGSVNEDILTSSSENSSCSSKSDLTDGQSLEKKKSEFAQFAPEFSTMALMETISQEDDVSIPVIEGSDDHSLSNENLSHNGNSCSNALIHGKKELKEDFDDTITSSCRGGHAEQTTHPFRRLKKVAASVKDEVMSSNYAPCPPEGQVRGTHRTTICRNHFPGSSEATVVAEDHITVKNVIASQSTIDKGEMMSSQKQKDQHQAVDTECGGSIKPFTQKPVAEAIKSMITSPTSGFLLTDCRKAGNLQPEGKDSSANLGITRPPAVKILPGCSRDEEVPVDCLYPPSKCLPDNLTLEQRAHFEKVETTFRARTDNLPNAEFWVNLNRKKETCEDQEPLFRRTPFGQILFGRSEAKCKAQQEKGFFLAASRNMDKHRNKSVDTGPLVKVSPLPDITMDVSPSLNEPSSGGKQFLVQRDKRLLNINSLRLSDSEDGRDD